MFFEEKGMRVAGRKIELIVEDSATSPSITLTKVKKLVDMDKVHVVILGQDSASGYAVRDYIHQNAVPTVALAMGAAHTRARYSPYFFRVTPSTYQYSYEPAKWLFNYGFKRLIYLANDIVPAREALEAMKKGLEELGGEVVQVLWVPVGNTDFGPFIPQIKTDKADAIFIMVWGAAAVRFIKQWVEYGKKGTIPIVGGGSTLDEGTSLPAMGLSAEGVFSSSYACPSTDLPENKRFADAYKGRTGKLPSFLGYYAYMAAQAAYGAADKINGEAENKENLVKSLKEVRFTTPMGSKAYFDQRNGMAVDIIFMQARRTNGEVHLFEIGRIREVKDPVKLFP
jgi:branched-chain amino acid transport system substrate-binding protein